MTRETLVAKVVADVEKYGWHCLSVHPRVGESGVSFTYTIGVEQTFGHPEMMIFGLSTKTAHAILSDCVEMIERGARFSPGTEYTDVIGGGRGVVFRKIREEFLDDYFGTARMFYGNDSFSGLIMFWPDKNGEFPWQETASTLQREALGLVESME